VDYTYNRLGQLSTVVDGTGNSSDYRSFTYNLGGTLELQREDLPAFFTNGSYNARLSYGYAGSSGVVGRPNAFSFGHTNNSLAYQNVTYGYQSDGRLSTVGGSQKGSCFNSLDWRTFLCRHGGRHAAQTERQSKRVML
jgi:hypothetical protein